MRHLEVFTGRIGRVEEIRELSNNNCVVNFSVAETMRVKDGDNWVDGATIWTNVAIFGDEARNLHRSVQPGTFVTVIGDRRASEYTPKDSDEKRTSQSVVAEQVAVSITKFNYIKEIGNVNYAKEGTAVTDSPSSQVKPEAKDKVDALGDVFDSEDDPFGLNS